MGFLQVLLAIIFALGAFGILVGGAHDGILNVFLYLSFFGFILIVFYKIVDFLVKKFYKEESKKEILEEKEEFKVFANKGKRANNKSKTIKPIVNPSSAYKSKPLNQPKKKKNKKADINIDYIKTNGEYSNRDVKIYEYDGEYIKGYCYLRNEERTFKIDRIDMLTDLKTGEIYFDDEIREYLEESFGYLKGSSYVTSSFAYNTKNYTDDGYFYGKVKPDVIAQIDEEFFIEYENDEFEVAVLKLGKIKNSQKLFILVRYLDSDDYAGLYVDKIKQMNNLLTGEIISDVKEYFRKFYELEHQKELEREAKRAKRESADKTIEQYENLLKFLVYIAKADGTLNAKERIILIDTLNSFDSSVNNWQEIIEKVNNKKIFYKNYNTFSRNAKAVIKKYPQIDFFEYAKKIVDTQKSIHTDEDKLLKYLAKAYNKEIDTLKQDEEIKQKTTKPLAKIEPCPYCGATENIVRKGQREYKNHIGYRFWCKSCDKIYSVRKEKTAD